MEANSNVKVTNFWSLENLGVLSDRNKAEYPCTTRFSKSMQGEQEAVGVGIIFT